MARRSSIIIHPPIPKIQIKLKPQSVDGVAPAPSKAPAHMKTFCGRLTGYEADTSDTRPTARDEQAFEKALEMVGSSTHGDL